jgi:hypothetical protein
MCDPSITAPEDLDIPLTIGRYGVVLSLGGIATGS